MLVERHVSQAIRKLSLRVDALEADHTNWWVWSWARWTSWKLPGLPWVKQLSWLVNWWWKLMVNGLFMDILRIDQVAVYGSAWQLADTLIYFVTLTDFASTEKLDLGQSVLTVFIWMIFLGYLGYFALIGDESQQTTQFGCE